MLPFCSLSIGTALKTLAESIKAIKSASFQTFLRLLLHYGNILNGGSARGNAKGFDLEILPRLTDLRDNSGHGNLMDFLIESLITQPTTQQDTVDLPLTLMITLEIGINSRLMQLNTTTKLSEIAL